MGCQGQIADRADCGSAPLMGGLVGIAINLIRAKCARFPSAALRVICAATRATHLTWRGCRETAHEQLSKRAGEGLSRATGLPDR
jgi:hypothetical protein